MRYAPTNTMIMMAAKTPMTMLRSSVVNLLTLFSALLFGGGGAGDWGPPTAAFVGGNVKGPTVDDVVEEDDVEMHGP
jgi:hypothetical protein